MKKDRINSAKESPNQRAKRHQKSNAKRTGSFVCKTHSIKINNETEKKTLLSFRLTVDLFGLSNARKQII